MNDGIIVSAEIGGQRNIAETLGNYGARVVNSNVGWVRDHYVFFKGNM